MMGVALAVVSGLCNGLFTTPMKLESRWKWENIWFTFILVACLLMPAALVFSSAGWSSALMRAHQGRGPPCRGKHQGSRHQQAGHKDEGEPDVLPFPARFEFHRCCKEAVAQPGHHRERDSHHDHRQLLIKNRLTSHPTMSNMSRTNVYTTCSTAKLSM